MTSAVKKLAINGGSPVRDSLLPYGRQWLDEDDIAAVEQVLRSDWLTTGPMVSEFEEAVARRVGTAGATAVSNGTAALHAAVAALEIGEGDEVVVPAMTFVATVNCVLYQGGKVIFADVQGDTLLLSVEQLAKVISPRTVAVIAVDYAGQPCDYDALREVTDGCGAALIADACHALGAELRGDPVGSLADLSCFSLHPVKHVTTGEGGIVCTDNENLLERMRSFRNHGISSDHRERSERGSWYYEIRDLGYNLRLTDFQCALGLSQLEKLDSWIRRRGEIAHYYDESFAELDGIAPLVTRGDNVHAYHLYVVRVDDSVLSAGRKEVFAALRAEGLGVNVHYLPVHLHPYYRKTMGTGPGLCPVAEAAYEQIISLPIFPAMSDSDVRDVVDAVRKVHRAYSV